ncbi:uncharacterized protein LOC130713292 [Lotus japonicus]|uniref:uncharacterized protein LOC130713292 n=1 Tax=Lotus japonicus TaxID=34305 RepID=UPI00258D26D1|nr:uncharacterized protein LOC130713292 [Lotus japonicus]
MRGKIPADQLQYDLEIEAIARRNNNKTKRRKQLTKSRKRQESSTSSNQEQGTMVAAGGGGIQDENAGFVNFTPRNMTRIGRPAGNERPMEMKSGLVQLMYANPFAGLDHENPHTHLTKFYELCGTAGLTQAEEEAVFLRLFPLTLLGQAKEWFLDQPQSSLTDWNELERKFLARYFSDSKFMDCKTAISAFSQGAGENLCETWERFKSLLRKCPNHEFDARSQIHIFRKGLQQPTRLILDATSGGSLMAKSPIEAIQIIEAMALNDQQDQHHRGSPRIRGMIDLGATDAVLAQNKQLQQQLDEVKQTLKNLPKQLKEMHDSSSRKHVYICDVCAGDHHTSSCDQNQEEVNYVGNQQRQGQYQGNYPKGGNQKYNQPWRQDACPSSSRAPPLPYQNQQYQQPPVDRTAKLEDTLNQFMQVSISNHKNTDASIKNLEIQVGQMAKQLSQRTTEQKGKFHANTEDNPREHCNAIFTRSGRVVGGEVDVDEKKNESHDPKESEKEEEVEKEEERNKREIDHERQKRRFLDIFRHLNITMPFSEALEQIPSYGKYMKDLLNKKDRLKALHEDEVIQLNGRCSAILQRLPPPKHRSSKSLVLPVKLDNNQSCNALIDSGATINLMPISLLKRLGDVEVEPTGMTLQLADKSVKLPQGIAENVTVMVEQLNFPIDFAVVDVPEDKEIPIILGMPFIITARITFDVDTGILKVRQGEDEVLRLSQPNDRLSQIQKAVTVYQGCSGADVAVQTLKQDHDAWPEDRPNSREEERAAGHGDGDEATTSAAANLRADDYMFDDQEQDGVED